jgi:hypothetical protein
MYSMPFSGVVAVMVVEALVDPGLTDDGCLQIRRRTEQLEAAFARLTLHAHRMMS